jgi:UPF0176 protein
MENIKVASFYRFLKIQDLERMREELLILSKELNLLGTMIIAEEGFNGSISGQKDSIVIIFNWLEKKLSIKNPIIKTARWANVKIPPFSKIHIKIKKEIVAIGREDIRPYEKYGKSVKPENWNQLIQNPETIIIDTRNKYEIDIGSFPGALNPETKAFRDFPAFAENIPNSKKNKPIAMFCTGGIRCEKAAALMIEMGFSDVNQLEGGILNYLENIKESENIWKGECFVFDDRVAVDAELRDGKYIQCHACRHPLSVDETRSPDYQEGISCPRCINTISKSRLKGFKERQKQIKLAKQRGEKHIGKVLDK